MPNHPTPQYFTDSYHQIHLCYHHSDEIQVSEKKIKYKPYDDIGKIDAL